MNHSAHTSFAHIDSVAQRLHDIGVRLDTATLATVHSGLRRLAATYAPMSSLGATHDNEKAQGGGNHGGRHAASDTEPHPGARRQSGAGPDINRARSSNHSNGTARPLASELPSSISELRRWISQRTVSVEEALRLQDRRFRERDAYIHSVARFCTWSVPQAPDAPLAGVGLAHKDNIATGEFAPGNGLPAADLPEASGATLPEADWPEAPEAPHGQSGATNRAAGLQVAPAIRRLQASGATQLATLVMAERACGATAENHHFPPVNNPLGDALFVGGSSSGSAAAVAAGLCYGALGTDTAGSVRIPAASCGLVGFKPSRNTLSGEGVVPLAPSLDTVGLLARSAADLQVLYAGATSATGATGAIGTSNATGAGDAYSPQHMAVANAIPLAQLAPAVAETLADFLARLASRMTVRDIPLTLPREAGIHGETVFYYEAARQHQAALQQDAAVMNVVARQLVAQGLVIPDAWYAQARQQRPLLREAFIARHFDQAELLLIPAFSLSVPRRVEVTFGEREFDPASLLGVYRWMMPANFFDLPALVMPVGTDGLGRPVSVQLLARPGAEARLLAFASWFEVENCDARGLFGLGAPHMQTYSH